MPARPPARSPARPLTPRALPQFRDKFGAQLRRAPLERRDDAVVAHISDAVGHGLFAHRRFECDEFVCTYVGTLDAAARVRDRRYAVQSAFDGAVIDAREYRSLGAFINHSRTASNVALNGIFEDGCEQVLVITTRAVERGEQFLLDYSSAYFDHDSDGDNADNGQVDSNDDGADNADAVDRRGAVNDAEFEDLSEVRIEFVD